MRGGFQAGGGSFDFGGSDLGERDGLPEPAPALEPATSTTLATKAAPPSLAGDARFNKAPPPSTNARARQAKAAAAGRLYEPDPGLKEWTSARTPQTGLTPSREAQAEVRLGLRDAESAVGTSKGGASASSRKEGVKKRAGTNISGASRAQALVAAAVEAEEAKGEKDRLEYALEKQSRFCAQIMGMLSEHISDEEAQALMERARELAEPPEAPLKVESQSVASSRPATVGSSLGAGGTARRGKAASRGGKRGGPQSRSTTSLPQVPST